MGGVGGVGGACVGAVSAGAGLRRRCITISKTATIAAIVTTANAPMNIMLRFEEEFDVDVGCVEVLVFGVGVDVGAVVDEDVDVGLAVRDADWTINA